jgi:uncharacterized protein
MKAELREQLPGVAGIFRGNCRDRRKCATSALGHVRKVPDRRRNDVQGSAQVVTSIARTEAPSGASCMAIAPVATLRPALRDAVSLSLRDGPKFIMTSPAHDPAQRITVLLPLSGRLSEAGVALRDGFLSAYFGLDAAQRPNVTFLDTGDDAVAVFRKAIAEPTDFIVGPLGKDEVARVAALSPGTLPVLVLNALPDQTTAPRRFFQFALAPEDEARAIAERAFADGRRVAAVLVPEGEWGSRVAAAFGATFSTLGGHVATSAKYPPATTDYSDVLVPLLGFEESQKRYRAVSALVGSPLVFTPRRRDDLEFVFFAGNPVQGRLLRPQLKFHYAGNLAVYATSDVHDPTAASNEDLEGVMFPDMPWMASDRPETVAARQAVDQLWPGDARHHGRLYAMGHDAALLAARLKDPVISTIKIDGETGSLTLLPNGRIQRELAWWIFGADGRAHPLSGAPTER